MSHPDRSRAARFAGLNKKLLTRVDRFEGVGRPLTELLLGLACKYTLPMAIEHVDRDVLQKPLHLKLKNQSVRRVIAAIVALAPGYRVDFSQGLVDIYPLGARRDPSNPFNTLIRRYDVDDLDTHLADAQLLCDIGRQLHGHSGCGGSVAGGQWGNRKISLHLKDKRVYEILNAIVVQNGEALWTPIAIPKEGSPLITGNFWYIYPLDPPFERSAIQGLQELLPPRQHAP